MQFLSTLPARGATPPGRSARPGPWNFYPRSPRGERQLPGWGGPSSHNFYPRSPRGERRHRGCHRAAEQYFYPRSPRGERLGSACVSFLLSCISIHAPREGSDLTCLKSRHLMAHISIHAPREGSDPGHPHFGGQHPGFLSTLPARGATTLQSFLKGNYEFLSTLPARGATHRHGVQHGDGRYFYPRSPRGERPGNRRYWPVDCEFLSTLPARGATRSATTSCRLYSQFLSTLPARGATQRGL